MAQTTEDRPAGLASGAVSGLEVLAQSVSEIAPSAVVGAVVALVVQTTGAASWVTWLVGGVVLLIVAYALTYLTARYGSPGGVYVLVARAAGPQLGYFTAWMAVISYVGGVVAVTYQISEFGAGFLNLPAFGVPYNALTTFLVAVVGVTVAAWCSYSNARISTRTMLVTESLSVVAITILMVMVLVTHHGSIVDSHEFGGFSAHDVLLGIPLVLFSFSGFESSTAFAREAKNPKRMITLAMVGSVAITSVFFVFCSYVLVLGFQGSRYDMAKSTNVLATTAKIVGVSWYGYLVDVGVILSMFAVIIALTNTSSRLLYTFGSERLLPAFFARVHPTRGTPSAAVTFVWAGCLAGVALVALLRASVVNAFGNMGTLTGDGQAVLYFFAVIAVAVLVLRARTRAGAWWVPLLAAVIAVVALGYLLYKSFVPLPAFPVNVFVYVLFGTLVLAVVLYPVVASRTRGRIQHLGSSVVEYDVAPTATDPGTGEPPEPS